ncbi:autophagy-related protein 13 homolog [Achroia grisella]|uniref:autophagy-related protein 13 homolog n=1 Tax=Achroia grisella TaxID=688607 RepID=UPI0027D2E40C|nr:autophagy-related protein 13 homolog [Achroia grisella]
MAPDAAFTNISDKNEFTKFTKFLAYKGVQVIVESRKGVKIEPNSKPISSDSGWFNLQIPDSPEVNQATKNALPSDKVLETIRSQLHVEISVQTEDGDEMVLELWTLELDETQFDTSLKAMNTVYFRMGILLKSLITITRMTPAYHLSRKQRSESFTIFYRVYNGEPKVKALGTSVKKMQAAMLKTPLGGISFSVTYRTNFSISPNKCDNTGILLLKSDHFELSPKHVIFESKKKKEHKDKEKKLIRPIDLNKPLRLAAFVDESLVEKTFKDFLHRIPVPRGCLQFRPKIPAKESPVESKSTQDLDVALISKSPTSSEMPPKKFSGIRSENEPPLKLLCFPFADNHPIRELAEFYKDFFNAPHLKLADDLIRSKSRSEESVKEEADNANEDLSKDLELYESSLNEFDELLADMCRSAEWSGN